MTIDDFYKTIGYAYPLFGERYPTEIRLSLYG